MGKTNKPKSRKAVKPRKRKSNAGRPTVMTPIVVAKLIEGFKHDFTDIEACHYAGIERTSFYRLLKKDPNFATEIEAAKVFLFTAAKKNIANAVANSKSVDDSWKLLQKRQKNLYSDRLEQTDPKKDLPDVQDLDERINEMQERLTDFTSRGESISTRKEKLQSRIRELEQAPPNTGGK